MGGGGEKKDGTHRMVLNLKNLNQHANTGTSHSEQLNALNNEIWDWCVARNLWTSAGHIAGKSNVEADQASRQNQSATEWMLQKTSQSHTLEQLQFTPEKDLFASRINCQFPQYVAYRPDPGAVAIDAFSVQWTGLKFVRLFSL